MTKSDINLLPKKKKLPLSVTLGIPLALILFAGVFAIGVFLPRMALSLKQTNLDMLEQEISSYSNVDSEYSNKLEEYNTLQNQQKVFMDFTESKKQTLSILNLINSIKPETIILQEFTFNNESVALKGTATTDIEIAKFIVALRKLAIFPEINLGNISGLDNVRSFDISLMHQKTDTSSIGGTSK